MVVIACCMCADVPLPDLHVDFNEKLLLVSPLSDYFQIQCAEIRPSLLQLYAADVLRCLFSSIIPVSGERVGQMCKTQEMDLPTERC